MKKDPNRYPKDCNAAKVRGVIEYYENQSDDEAAAEIEQAKEVESPTWMRVPPELVPKVEKLIQRHRESA
jgi:hypothetical protein